MDNNHELSELLIDLIMEIRKIYGNKKLRKVRIRTKIYDTKKKIKLLIYKKQYDAYDIYKFLLFMGMAKTLGIFINIPKNISYNYYRSKDVTVPSSGVLSVTIDYDKYKKMNVIFKPIVSLEESKINMEWIISDNKESIIDYKMVSSDTRIYSSTVTELKDIYVNPNDHISQTKILEYSSCSILYQTFIICIESIFNEIERKYIYEKK